MEQKKETTFKESVDLMYDRAVKTLNLPIGLAEQIRTCNAVYQGNKLGLEVHAGHGLTYTSAKILAKIKGIQEFNIGHFLVGESIFEGMPTIIKKFKKILKK